MFGDLQSDACRGWAAEKVPSTHQRVMLVIKGLQFDFDRQQLKILPASTVPNRDWGDSFDVSYDDGGLPTIRVVLSDELNEECVVDTGYNGSLALASHLYSKLLNNQSIHELEGNTRMQLNGSRTVREGRLSEMKVGEFESRNLLVSDGGGHSTIGLKYLRRFRVTLDLPHSKIYLAKGAGFDAIDEPPRFGMSILRKQSKTIVVRVSPDCPAGKAEIAIDDDLVEVAGDPTAGKPVPEIQWLMNQKAKQSGSVDLVLRRGGEERKVSISIHE